MKILAIVGTNVTSGKGMMSKDKQPSADRMAGYFFDKLTSSGHIAEKVSLSGYHIDFCDHCEVCDKKETCPLGDDFWPIYEKMKTADAIIFLTSVAYGMMNPKLATFLQRAGRIARSNGKSFSGKASGLLIEEVRSRGDAVLEQFKIWFESEGMQQPLISRVTFGEGPDGRHISLDQIEPIRQRKANELAEAFLLVKS